MTELISYQVTDSVAIIRFNRPKKYNSFVREKAMALQQYLKDAEADENVRAVYLTGNGPAFCAGQDLNEVVEDNGIELEKIVSEHYNPIIKLMRSLKLPIICAVNGVAAGAGANIALAGDIVVAKESATFIQAFSKIGLIPDSGGTFTLPRLVGWQKASALIMLGDKVSAEEAERMGMIYKWYPDSEFDEKSFAIAQKIASMPTQGLILSKVALNESANNNLNDQLHLEGELQARAAHSHDYNEGVRAFLEKRKAKFTGK